MDASNLCSAIRSGNINAVRTLISQGININERAGKSGYTPLHLATYNGHEDILKLLLESDAHVNLAENQGNTALHYAVSRLTNLAIVQCLLACGADVNGRNILGESALYLALKKPLIRRNKILSPQDRQILELLIQSGADVNQPDDEGRTPLHVSVVLSDLEVVRMLYNAGAHEFVDARDDKGNTPVHLAVLTRDARILDLLLMGAADCNIENNEGFTPLHFEVLTGGKCELARKLIDAGADANVRIGTLNRTVLHLAAKRDNVELMEDLVAGGADVNAQDSQGRTPLHYLAIDNCRARSFNALLRNGADENVVDESGRTPMDYLDEGGEKLKVLKMIFELRKGKKNVEDEEENRIEKQERTGEMRTQGRKIEYLQKKLCSSSVNLISEAYAVSMGSLLLFFAVFISVYYTFFYIKRLKNNMERTESTG